MPKHRAAAVSSPRWDENPAAHAGVWARARRELGRLHSQLADHQSMAPTEAIHGAQTSAANVREAAIFTEGWARAEPVGRRASGGKGRLGLGGWFTRSLGENAPRQGVWGRSVFGAGGLAHSLTRGNAPHPPASPPAASGEAEGRRDGRTEPQQDGSWTIPWGPVTHSYMLTDTHSTLIATQGHTRHTGHTLQQALHAWTWAPGGAQVGSLRWS